LNHDFREYRILNVHKTILAQIEKSDPESYTTDTPWSQYG